jgi:formate dehydrogenase major subunit
MGCDPGILTGSIPLEEGRADFEKVWRAAIPTNKGLDLMEMIDSARDGGLKALWSVGYDIFLTNPNADDTADALRCLEFVVIQDMFMNETAREFGDVFLPAASSFEKDGTFMNAERRIQRVRKAVEPRANSRSDWQIICDMARAMGKGAFFDYESAEDIWNEVRAVWDGAAGISYERIEEIGFQWPCIAEDKPPTGILHANEFAHEKRAKLRRIHYHPSPEKVDYEYPFLLNTGRTRYTFNSGTMTSRTPNIELRTSDLLAMNPSDLAALSLTNGDSVRVTSRYGEAILPVANDPSIRRAEAFATFHDPRVFVNRLTGPHRDRFVHSPEYKLTAVRIERVK